MWVLILDDPYLVLSINMLWDPLGKNIYFLFNIYIFLGAFDVSTLTLNYYV